MKIIGLTGGIGTGKSTVSRYLTEKGYEIVDADKIARQVVEPGSPTLDALAERFGREILLEDGSLDRRRLAGLAFATPEGKQALDGITHGAIFACIDERIAEARGPLLFLDIPLLFETGQDEKCDMVWVVDVPDEERIRRIMMRDGLTRDEIAARIKNQMSREEKLARADVVLDNSGAVEDLYAQVDRLLSQGGGEPR